MSVAAARPVRPAVRRTPLRRGDEAVSSVVGTLLSITIVVSLAIVLTFAVRSWSRQQPAAVDSGAKATFSDDGYWVEPTGPDSIPIAGARMRLTVDGSTSVVPLTAVPMLSGLTSWPPGLRVCIMGDAASCYLHQGNSITIDLYSAHDYVFTVQPLRSSSLPFSTGGGGGLVTHGTRDVVVRALGSQYSCGNTMPVTARVTTDGGLTWITLFGGAAITPGGSGQTYDAGAVPTNHVIGVEASGHQGSSCGIGDYTFDSVSSSPQALILKAGDPAPNYAPYQGQAPLANFLVPYVNTQTQTMVLAPNQVIIFFDLCCYPNSAVDFQDAVFLITFN